MCSDSFEVVKISLVSQVSRLKTVEERTNSLLALYDGLPHEQGEDLLRAVVVWLHGALEEALRLHVGNALRDADQQTLNQVPLFGITSIRPEKFLLGSLANFRGHSVDCVISQSVDAYVQRLTFNDFTDVARALECMPLTPECLESLKSPEPAAAIEVLCRRRHRIVHEGDLLPGLHPSLRALDKETVVHWQHVVMSFVALLVVAVEATRCEIAMGPEWTAEQRRLRAEEGAAREAYTGQGLPKSASSDGSV